MMLVDTSGLAAIDSTQRAHAPAARSLSAALPPLVLSPFVVAELDYLLATRVGEAARLSLLAEVARGAYRLEAFSTDDVQQAEAVIRHHAGLGSASPTRRSSSWPPATRRRTCSRSTSDISVSFRRTASR